MTDITFREFDHTYWHGERQIPSVTSVIDVWAQAYAGVPESILGPARERGTAVHLATQYDDEGDLDDESVGNPLIGYVEAWRAFKIWTGFKSTHAEQMVFNQRYWYAGTLDRRGSSHKFAFGNEILLDIKTGSALRATTALQTAAYADALRTDRRTKPLPRWGVELHKDSTWRLEEFTDPDDLATFLAALRLYNWRLKHGT